MPPMRRDATTPPKWTSSLPVVEKRKKRRTD